MLVENTRAAYMALAGAARARFNGRVVAVTGSAGKTTTWAIECGAPNALLRRGWNKNSLPVGSEIVVDGYRAKNGSATANAKDITTADGKKLFMGSSGTGAPYEEKK